MMSDNLSRSAVLAIIDIATLLFTLVGGTATQVATIGNKLCRNSNSFTLDKDIKMEANMKYNINKEYL